jgi:carbon monoxide dehydrogenase subunit G
MKEAFSRHLVVASRSEEVWGTLLDVPRVASWVTIVGSVQEVSPLQRYSAVLQDRMGPFRLRADLDIRIVELEPGSYVKATAAGEDRQVGSRISIEATLRAGPQDGGTGISLEGSFEVTGRVATLGAGSIRKKADRVLEEFCRQAADSLTG